MAIDKEKTLQAAQRAIEKKRFDLAIDEYRKLAAAEKNDPRWLLKIGDTQQKKGDFAAAIGSYEEVARFYSSQGFHLKAVAVYNTVRDLLGRQPPQLQAQYAYVPVKLAELYEKLQLTSDALATWDTVADRLQKEGRDREAIEVYRRIVALDPSNPLAHLRLAEALSRQKDIEGAIEEFAATAEQLTAQRRFDDALKVYERLLHHRQDPQYARPAAELYLARGGPNDGVAAIAKIQIGLKSDPRSVELIALLARGFVAIGQIDKAITIFKEAARLAAEQQSPAIRRDIIRHLQRIAPNDDQVRLLARELVTEGSRPRADLAGRVDLAAQDRPLEPPSFEPTGDADRPRLLQKPRGDRGRPAWIQESPYEDPHAARTAAGTEELPLEEVHELEELDDADEVQPVESSEIETMDATGATDAMDVDVDDEAEAAEERSQPKYPSAHSHAARVAEVVANADAFHRLRLSAKAITTLRIALELDPRNIFVRERIRDILIESGETDLAIAEMVALSEILLEDGDLQGAYDNLAWILEADPEHPEALQWMERLQEMAAEVPVEGAPEEAPFAPSERLRGGEVARVGDFEADEHVVDLGSLAAPPDDEGEHADAAEYASELEDAEGVYRIESLAPGDVVEDDGSDERLPSYADDFDEAGATSPTVHPEHEELALPPPPVSLVDDSELPRYLLDEPLASARPPPANRKSARPPEPRDGARRSASPIPPPLGHPYSARGGAISPAVRPGVGRSSIPASTGAEVESALEEADFYASQGVYETARETLEDSLRLSPHNSLLLEKLREIEAAAARAQAELRSPDRAFDIAASLDALDMLDRAEQPKFAGPDQIDVEEVFAKFKMGVAAQVDASDSATHYDLGIAYEQMMLYDDAINEFRIAARDPTRAALCHNMIGFICMKKGCLPEATEAFRAGLHTPDLGRNEELALLYELGNVWELRRNRREAAYYFKRVVSADPRYRDAKERLAGVEARLTDRGSGARPKGEIEDDFDAAIDDAIKRKAH